MVNGELAEWAPGGRRILEDGSGRWAESGRLYETFPGMKLLESRLGLG